jgi:hypothetical protein
MIAFDAGIAGQRGELLGSGPIERRRFALGCWESKVGQWCQNSLGFSPNYLTPILAASAVGGIIAYLFADRDLGLLGQIAVFLGQVIFSLMCGTVAAALMPPCNTSSAALVGLTGSATCYALFTASPIIKRKMRKLGRARSGGSR